MSQKGSIHLIIVLIVALLVGYFFYTKYLDTNELLDLYQTNTPIVNNASNSAALAETKNWKMYINKYYSVLYPDTWYIWSFGRGVDLAYWQINSVPIDQQSASNTSYIGFDIQGMNTTAYSTLEEYRNYLQKMKKEKPQYNLVISEIMVNGQKAISSEKTADSTPDNNPTYERIVWLEKNGRKYIITWTIRAQTVRERGLLKSKHQFVFNQILSTFKFTQ